MSRSVGMAVDNTVRLFPKMERDMSRMPVLLAAVLVAGCAAPTYWVKPSATSREVEFDKSECVTQAYQQFPPIPEPPAASPLPDSGISQINCNTYGNQTSCTSYTLGSLNVRPISIYIDPNLRPREAVYQSCMYRRGYALQRAR